MGRHMGALENVKMTLKFYFLCSILFLLFRAVYLVVLVEDNKRVSNRSSKNVLYQNCVQFRGLGW